MNQATSEANEEVHYVGFWARFLAFIIDSTAATLLIVPLVLYLIGETRLEDYDLQDTEQLMELLNRMAIQISLDALFLGTIFVLFWIFKSATPGKMLVRCSIVDAKTYGKANTMQNIVRYLGYFVSLIPFGLGFLWIAFDSRKQGWHDKMAGTLVIKGLPRNI
ncbi:MAG: RDD family protein [Gammaproteobacteria bacterium]|nr:RDD family protein [Gammaproteobacteria bacterium]